MQQLKRESTRSETQSKRRDKRRSSPQSGAGPPRSDGEDSGAVDRESPGHDPARLSPSELRGLSRELYRLALRYAPEDSPQFDRLMSHLTSEAFVQSQATGYRIAQDPYRALLGLSRAVKRSAAHRSAEGRGGSR